MKTYRINEGVRNLMKGKTEEEVTEITKRRIGELFSKALDENSCVVETEVQDVWEKYTKDYELGLGYYLYDNQVFQYNFDENDLNYYVEYYTNKSQFMDTVNRMIRKLRK